MDPNQLDPNDTFELPTPSAWKLTTPPMGAEDEATETVYAHKIMFLPFGGLVFSVLEMIPGAGYGWVEVVALNQHEWLRVERIAGPSSSVARSVLLS